MLQQLTPENPEALCCIGFNKTFILKFKVRSISILLFIGWGESVSSVGIVLVFSTFFLRFFCVFSEEDGHEDDASPSASTYEK